jgi:hypothetical protein
MEYELVWIFGAVLVAMFASRRGRNGGGWFVLSLLISPILAVLFVLVLPPLGATYEQIAAIAAVEGLPADSQARRLLEAKLPPPPQKVEPRGPVGILIILALLIAAAVIGSSGVVENRLGAGASVPAPAPRTEQTAPAPQTEIVVRPQEPAAPAPAAKPEPEPYVEQAKAPVAPRTLPPAALAPLSSRLAEINQLTRQSLPIATRHCGSDAACRKEQTAAIHELAAKETAIAKALRNPTTYAAAVRDNDTVNACIVMWSASEDFAAAVQCINDAQSQS